MRRLHFSTGSLLRRAVCPLSLLCRAFSTATPDFYSLLGVSPSAPAQDLLFAYKHAAFESLLNLPSGVTQARFHEINRAFAKLSADSQMRILAAFKDSPDHLLGLVLVQALVDGLGSTVPKTVVVPNVSSHLDRPKQPQIKTAPSVESASLKTKTDPLGELSSADNPSHPAPYDPPIVAPPTPPQLSSTSSTAPATPSAAAPEARQGRDYSQIVLPSFVISLGSRLMDSSSSAEEKVPAGIACDSQGLWVVSDLLRHKIQVFQPTGELVRSFGEEGSGPGQFHSPYGVAILPNGNYIISEYMNHRLQIVTPTGDHVAFIGCHGTEDGCLWYPKGLRIDHQSRIVVADSRNNRVCVFTQDGQFVTSVKNLHRPMDVAVDAEGNYVIAEWETGFLCISKDDGTVLRKVQCPSSQQLLSCRPIAVAVDNVGNYIVLDKDGWAAQVLNPTDGKLLHLIRLNGEPKAVMIQNGKVVVTCGDGSVYAY